MINKDARSLRDFINTSYWENPEDAIGDIRKYMSDHPYLRIWYKNGTYKDVPKSQAWEFENDPDWDRTEEE